MDIPTQLKILFLTTLANWISKEKSHMIEYLLVANRILKSKLESDGRRIKYTDSEPIPSVLYWQRKEESYLGIFLKSASF